MMTTGDRPRLLVANLGAEIEMARESSPGPHPPLGSKVATLVARAGSHLAVFGRPNDWLWLPAPLAPDARAAWAREMNVVTGPLAELPPPSAVLAWAETTAIAALRGLVPAPVEGPGDAAGGEVTDGNGPRERSWRQWVWRLSAPPEVVAQVNHRRFASRIAEALGTSLPGARFLSDVGDVERHLASGGAEASDGSWVVKAPHAAAGRERVRRSGTSIDPETKVRLERLFARYGELLFEPWVARVADLACCGVVLGPSRAIIFAPHRLECDASGVFRAITIDDVGFTVAAAEHLTTVRDAAVRCAEELARAGYSGPFGVDSYLYLDPRGGPHRLRPIGEINARFTFGHVARASRERTAGASEPFHFRLV